VGEVLVHIPMARSFTGHYVGVSRHTPRAGSFTGHYVGVSRHTSNAVRFTGHYVGEVLDTYQWPGEFHRSLRGGFSLPIKLGSYTIARQNVGI